MLSSAVRLQTAEDLAKDVLLPRQQEERLPGRLALGVLQHLLEEAVDAGSLRLVDARTANRVR